MCLVQLPGVAARADLLAAIAGGQPGAVVVLTTLAGQFKSALLRAGTAEGRFGILPPATEPAEFALRLAQYETGTFRLLAVSPQQAWLPEVVLSLRSLPPTLIALDLTGLSAGLYESIVFAQLIVRRFERETPGTPIVILSDPIAPGSTRLLPEGATLKSVRYPEVVPAALRLRVLRVRHEGERLDRLWRLCRERGRSIVVVAPTRGAATRLRDALRDRGFSCGLLHGGLTAAERSTVLEAIVGSRLRGLVATETALAEAAMEGMDLVLFSHPPAMPESICRAASWVGEVVVLCAGRDLAALPGRALTHVPTLAEMREVYYALRLLSRGGYALIASSGDALARRRSTNRSRTGLCLGVLELAGYCSRLDEFPRAAVLTAVDGRGAPPALPPALRVGAEDVRAFAPLQMAAQLRQSPVYLQRSLLAHARDGEIEYQPHGRQRLYELSKPAPRAAHYLSRIVAALSAAATRGAASMPALLATAGPCRVQALAVALSWPSVPPCGRCDRCRPEHSAPRPASDLVLALQALAGVPFSMRRGAANRIVTRALRDEGRPFDRARVAGVVDELVSRGLIESRPGRLGDLYIVGDLGRAAMQAWDQV